MSKLIKTLEHHPIGYLLVERTTYEGDIVFRYDAANKVWRERWDTNENPEGKPISTLHPAIFEQKMLEKLDETFQSDCVASLTIELSEDDQGKTTYFATIAKLDNGLLLFSLIAERDQQPLNQIESEAPKEAQRLKDKNMSLENKVSRQKNQYKSASEELDDFTYSVSHDLRAPLRRLDGFSEALLQDKYVENLDEKGIHYLNRIRQAAQDMGQLIDDLLKLSRISRREIEREEVNISKLANHILDSLREDHPELDIVSHVDEQISLEADPGLAKVVLQNLLSNAVKFSSKQDSCHIEVGVKDVNPAVIYVRDNGVGFDKKFAEKLFRAFQRLHSGYEFEGTGIGLATVKRIVNMHGGEVWAESPEGEGATFSFTLNR